MLLTATLCLIAAGAVFVYSATSTQDVLNGEGTSGDLVRFVVYGGLGLAAMRWLSRRPLDRLAPITRPLLGASLVLLVAVCVPHIGLVVNGGRRWLGRGPLEFQPSELAKLALVLHAATVLASRPRRARGFAELRPLLLPATTACLLVVLEPDLGTAMVMGVTVLAMLVAAGVPRQQLLLIVGVAVGLIVLLAIARPYERSRLTSFIDPWAHSTTSGFQSVHGQIALGSGGLIGRGPGQSVQKAFYLPEAQTDFILAVIGEELGAVGVCGLLFLYGLIAFAGMRAARKARSFHSALIAAGVTSLIVCQALLNVFAVLGLAPLTGVPLPFVSYGSSDLLVMLACMGLLLNVASGGTAHVRSARPRERGEPRLPPNRPEPYNDERARADEDRDRRRRDRRARRARARGG
ncbi:MAG TPA: putative lipid II flippase FtsW [Solirubrobacteraceae bacterium]|jgi:cell division protein FtsW|nr:putative lipid II flippase FtsW [Solirubrobacteraceae bacterium]